MRIAFSMDGGFAAFPGLARPVTIDVDTLPEADAVRLRGLVSASDFFGRAEPAAIASARGAADQRSFTIAIDDGDRRRTLTVPETVDDAPLKALIDVLQAHRRAALAR